MLTFLNTLAAQETCAIYNDLSHINPRYLTPGAYDQTFLEEEVLYHKQNIILLSLYFDKIVICTDNILAFTRFMSKDIVSSVVMSGWFDDLVQSGIIVFAGWGSATNLNMMENQIQYSNAYRPELKEDKYVNFLSEISERAHWVVREPGPGEADHIDFLRPLVPRMDGVFESQDISFLSDLIEHTNESVGYVGTMEMFPYVDELFPRQREKANAFYSSYYLSWHAYCAQHYSPAIPIHTDRIRLPATRTAATNGNRGVLSSLFAPSLFQKYLISRFGHKLTSRIMSVDMQRLLEIRNGDWAKFKTKYHEYLATASDICWIAYHPRAHELISDENLMDELLSEIFRRAHKDADLSGLGSAIDVAIGFFSGFPVLRPALQIFRKQINHRIGNLADAILHRELEPYLRKLGRVLDTSVSMEAR